MISYPEYKPQIVKFCTYAGKIILWEEVLFSDSTRKYYALESQNPMDTNLFDEIENKSALKEAQHFRGYDKMVTLNMPLQAFSKDYYLFNFVLGNLVEHKILDYRASSLSTPIRKIKYYISQLLQALYQLHKLNILGRQFATTNILDDERRIIMMDFGFLPDFQEQTDCIILQPPEIVNALHNKQQLKYNTKLDSWLLGAFLYHLVKLKPITTQTFRSLNEYFKQLEKLQQEQQTHFSSLTKRYENDGLFNFIDQLLVFDPEKRLSFLQIYQCEYVKKLKIPQSEDIEQFYYLHENQKSLLDKIQRREQFLSATESFSSDQIQPALNQLNSELEFNHFFSLQLIQEGQPQKSQGQSLNSSIILQEQNFSSIPDSSISDDFNEDDITKRFYCRFDLNSSNEDSKYEQIYLYIQMEQYRCFMLIDTANDVAVNLQKTNFGLVDLITYFFQRKCGLLLQEFLDKLKSENFPWSNDVDLESKWQMFRNEHQKQFLELNLIKEKVLLEDNLISNGTSVYQKYINDTRVDENIRASLQSDYDIQFKFHQDSNNFLQNGFCLTTAILYFYLSNEMRVKHYGFILKTVICCLIHSALDYETVNSSFPNLKPSNIEGKLTPQEINDFIIRNDNDNEKIKQINFFVTKIQI